MKTEQKNRGMHQVGENEEMRKTIDAIHKLRSEKNAIILAHYYQRPEVQDIADYVGDSLGLSEKAAETNADIIVFAGVHFMAETAKILNPHKTVLLPDLEATCSLALSCPPESFEEFIAAHPGHTVVSYINCSAEVKAMSDVICTSSNALKIIESLPERKPIIFAPDKNLGRYLMKETGRNMVLWDGACVVHEAFSIEKLLELYSQHPGSKIIAHPESEAHILKVASYIGSTTGMIKYVKERPTETFIVATEVGILHQMQKEVPTAKLIAAPIESDNTCACSECAYMKVITLEKILTCLEHENPQIYIDEHVRKKALGSVKLMMDLSTM